MSSEIYTYLADFTWFWSLGLAIHCYEPMNFQKKVFGKIPNTEVVHSVPKSSEELIFVERRAEDGRFCSKNTGIREGCAKKYH